MHVAKYWRNKSLYYRLNDNKENSHLQLQASIDLLEQDKSRVQVYSGNRVKSEERSKPNG